MRQSDKIIYSLTSILTNDELKNVIHYAFTNRPIDEELWYNLLEKFNLTDIDFQDSFHNNIKKLTYDAFIVKRIDYDEVSNNISLLRARKHINKAHKNISYNELFRGWLLYISANKNYFYDCAWKEQEQNKILDFFNIKYENAYRDNNLTLMFCVYYVKGSYKRNINDYDRYLSVATNLSDYLIKTKNNYDKIKTWINRFIIDLYNKPNGKSMYNIIDAYNGYINNIIHSISYGWYTSRVDVHIDTETQKLILNVNFIKTDKVDYGFVDITKKLRPLFELIKEDMEYFNTYGQLFNIQYT